MNLNVHFNVSEGKVRALRERIARLGIDVSCIEEGFIRGGGKGGQKINKTANCVVLRYPPLNFAVRCQRDRRQSVNRFLALRELVDKIEMRVSPETSQRLEEVTRLRKRKACRRQRSRKKYGVAADGADRG